MRADTMAVRDSLTPREQQVAHAVARGLTNRQVAEEFGISAETVKRHLASIYSKLSLPGRVALAILIVREHPGEVMPRASSPVRPAAHPPR